MYTQIKHSQGTQGDIWIICSGHQRTQEEQERTILMVGGDQIKYPGEKSTRTAGLTTAKFLINSIISTLGAKFFVIVIKKIYLNTPLRRFEYMAINLSSLPQETIDKKYNLM
jgi:hypothetical protein